MRRGEVFWAGRRLVIVVSHDGFNEVPGWRSVIVVPLTTSDVQARRGPTAIPLGVGTGGLDEDSIALCHQVTTLDRIKLTERIGLLPADALARVETGLRVALDLE